MPLAEASSSKYIYTVQSLIKHRCRVPLSVVHNCYSITKLNHLIRVHLLVWLYLIEMSRLRLILVQTNLSSPLWKDMRFSCSGIPPLVVHELIN